MKKIFLLSILLMSVFCIPAFAHGGSLDENGGHYDRSTGEYHYHHGYPAHQHEGGECPYNFDDQTNTSCSKKNNTNSKKVLSTQPTPPFVDLLVSTIFSVILAYGLGYVPLFLLDLIADRLKLDCFLKQNYFYHFAFLFFLIWLHFNTLETYSIILKRLALTVYISYCVFCIFSANLKKHKERLIFEKLYENVDIYKACDAPENATVDSCGNPHLLVNDEDLFVVYISHSGKVFHKYGCNYSAVKPINIMLAQHNYRPCKKCKPEIPPTDWYYKYREISDIKKRYGIP